MFKKKDKYTIKIASMFTNKDGHRVIKYENVERKELPKNIHNQINKRIDIRDELGEDVRNKIDNEGNFKDNFWE